MTVESEDEHLLGIGGSAEDAGHIAVGGDGELHLAYGTALDVEAVDADDAVLRPCYGVLVVEGAGIVGIVRLLGVHALVPGEAEHGHVRLVVANPGQHGVVGVEVESTGEGELLFVHPVWLAVDDFIELAVLRHLAFAVVEEQLDEEEVAFADESHHRAVATP